MSNWSSNQLISICDCGTKDALVCKEHPDCRPSYCKMRLFDSPITVSIASKDVVQRLRERLLCEEAAQALKRQKPVETKAERPLNLVDRLRRINAINDDPARYDHEIDKLTACGMFIASDEYCELLIGHEEHCGLLPGTPRSPVEPTRIESGTPQGEAGDRAGPRVSPQSPEKDTAGNNT